MVSWSLTSEQRAKVREAFEAIDTKHTGTITLLEMKQALQQAITIEDEEVRSIFDTLDGNHNEVVNYSEFLAAMVTTRITLHDDLIKSTFNRFDHDRSGFITAENLRQVLDDSHSPEEIDSMLKEVDFNSDQKIDFDEFFKYLTSGDCSAKHHEIASAIVDSSLRKGIEPLEAARKRGRSVVRKSGESQSQGIIPPEPGSGAAGPATEAQVPPANPIPAAAPPQAVPSPAPSAQTPTEPPEDKGAVESTQKGKGSRACILL
jgi:Ca2+-binding EF-hand superfamily protein